MSNPLRCLLHPLLHPVDAWLWRSGVHNERVREVVLWQLALTALLLGMGLLLLLPLGPWLVWCGVGFALIAQVFYGLARYFSRMTLTAYDPLILLGALGRMGVRLGITAVVLYVALVRCAAPPLALCCGLCLAPVAAFATYALGAARGAGGNQAR